MYSNIASTNPRTNVHDSSIIVPKGKTKDDEHFVSSRASVHLSDLRLGRTRYLRRERQFGILNGRDDKSKATEAPKEGAVQ